MKETVSILLAMSIVPVIVITVLMCIYFAKLNKLNTEGKKCTVQTTATVVSTENKTERRVHYNCPTFEYEAEGKVITLKYDYREIITDYEPLKFTQGKQVEIRYNPENPQQIYVPSDTQTRKNLIAYPIVAGITLGLTLIAILIMAVKNKMK